MNRAPAARPFSFPIRVEHQPGSVSAEVTSLTVEASIDNGRQWHPLQLRKAGDHWIAVMNNPAEGQVSLRATAKDKSGNTTTQTIKDAYAVTP